MKVEEGISLVEKLINRKLTDLELLIFRESWQGKNGKTYEEIGNTSGYSTSHVNDTASDLWKLLSKVEALKEVVANQKQKKVTKLNLKIVLEDYWRWRSQSVAISLSGNTSKNEAQFIEKTSSIESNFSQINNSENDIDALVKNIKHKRDGRIKFQCGKLYNLHIREIEITKIYVDVNILEEPTNERRLEKPDLMKNLKLDEVNPEKFDRLGWSKGIKRKSGLEVVGKYQNLMVLSKPGSGKTTFLKGIAIKCNDNEDNFLFDRLPIFISLKQLSDDQNLDNEKFDFLNYIFTEEFSNICEKEELEKILGCGKALILLDGLDEVVPAEKAKELAKSIQKFANSSKYYQNKFIISCRIAVQEYKFEKFDYIEIADFNEIQVKNFVENWFVAVKSSSPENGMANAKQFLERIQFPKNKQIRELAVTPILLNLACVVFQDRLDFPSKRSDLYEEALDILLKNWDKKRGIQRDEVYEKLLLPHKKKLLIQVAAATFETGDYFFKSEKVQKLIAEYLQNLTDSNQDKNQLKLNSEAVLKSLEAQHGLLIERANKIYSFSHLTFHEYFTAKFFIDNSDWEKLLDNLTDKRWREVFLLTVQSLGNADNFLLKIKNRIDKMAARDKLFQDHLKWISGKVSFIDHRNRYKLAAIRAIYLGNAPGYDTLYRYWGGRIIGPPLALSIDAKFAIVYKDIENNLFFSQEYGIFFSLHLHNLIGHYAAAYYYYKKNYDEHCIIPESTYVHSCVPGDLPGDFVVDKRLEDFIPIGKKNIPNLKKLLKKEKGDSWWKDILEWWNLIAEPQVQELLFKIVKYNFERPDFKFGSEQFELYDKYYNANKLLIDCLNTNSNVSPEVREEIEETLLLPLEEIEKWKQQNRPNNS